uniref:Putative ATP-binding protein n=1 Tax=Mycobacterium sp. (strain KMS) TaxID=189918 RepID=A1UMP9_MYCSK
MDEILSTDGVRRYTSRANHLSADSLSSDPFMEQLRSRTREPLVGQSGGDLLTLLTPVDDNWRRPRDWPKNGRDVSGLLRRHAPALRTLGWVVEDDGARNHRNVLQWTIYPPYKDLVAHRTSQSSRAALTQIGGNANATGNFQKAPEAGTTAGDGVTAEAS